MQGDAAVSRFTQAAATSNNNAPLCNRTSQKALLPLLLVHRSIEGRKSGRSKASHRRCLRRDATFANHFARLPSDTRRYLLF